MGWEADGGCVDCRPGLTAESSTRLGSRIIAESPSEISNACWTLAMTLAASSSFSQSPHPHSGMVAAPIIPIGSIPTESMRWWGWCAIRGGWMIARCGRGGGAGGGVTPESTIVMYGDGGVPVSVWLAGITVRYCWWRGVVGVASIGVGFTAPFRCCCCCCCCCGVGE